MIAGSTFNRKDLQDPVDFIYTNPASLKDEVLILTTNSIYTFNKSSKAMAANAFPPCMVPAFSFTGGTVKDREQVILYALHHDQSKTIEEEFGYTTVWTSLDNGATWKKSITKLSTTIALK